MTRSVIETIVDRYETSVVLLVMLWTAAFVLRLRLAQADRLTDIRNEALLSLLLVIPAILVSWAALAIADRRLGLGLFRSNGSR